MITALSYNPTLTSCPTISSGPDNGPIIINMQNVKYPEESKSFY